MVEGSTKDSNLRGLGFPSGYRTDLDANPLQLQVGGDFGGYVCALEYFTAGRADTAIISIASHGLQAPPTKRCTKAPLEPSRPGSVRCRTCKCCPEVVLLSKGSSRVHKLYIRRPRENTSLEKE